MSFHYDPMTGERIEDPEVTQETNSETANAETNTETTNGETTNAETVNSETNTAESEQSASAEVVESTAEEVKQEESTQPEIPVTGLTPRNEFNAIPEERGNDNGPSAGPIIAIILAAVVVIAALGFVVFKFMGTSKYGKNGKFITAFEKSMEWGSLAEAMDISDIVSKGESTMTLDAKVNGQAFNTEYTYDRNAGEYSIYTKFKIDDFTVDATIFMDREKAMLSVPALLKEPLMYNYVEEKTGYIADFASKYHLDDLDESMKTSTTDVNPEKYQKKLKDVFIKSFNDLDFKKTDAETFEINGKDKKCKGYTAQLNEEFYKTFSEGLEEFFEEYSEDISIDNKSMENFKKSIEKFNEEIENIPDSSITIYLTDGKVARAELDSDDHEAYIEFNGGNYWTENMTLGYDDSDIEIFGDVEKGKESRTVECNGEDVVSYVYDTKKGDLEFTLSAGMVSGTIEGNLTKKKSGFELAISDISASGVSLENYLKDFEATLRVEKGADVREIDEDDAYDLISMSEEDYKELTEKVVKNLEEVKDSLPDSLQSLFTYGLGASSYGLNNYGGSSYGDYGSDYNYGDYGYGSDDEDEDDDEDEEDEDYDNYDNDDNYDDDEDYEEDDDDYNSLFGNY